MTGYTFAGWTKSGTCSLSGTTFTYGAGACTLTASWTANPYTITFEFNGGYIGNPAEIDSGYESGTIVKLEKNVSIPVKQGNQINLKTNQKYMLSYEYIADGTVLFNNDFYPDTLPEILPTATTNVQTMNWILSSDSSDMSSSRIRFFNNKTIPNPYEIRISNIRLYECDNCSTTSSKTVTFNNTYGTLPTPTRSGYNFLGWYTQTSGGTKRTYTTMPATNETLYAQWEQNKTITFTNGYSVSGSGGGGSNGNNGSATVDPLPIGVTVYYTLAAGGSNGGSGSASISYNGTTIDSLSSSSNDTKSGSFTTETSGVLSFVCHGGGPAGSSTSTAGGGGGTVTITKIVDANGNEYILA